MTTKTSVFLAALLVGPAFAQPVQWREQDGGNGHWYQTVPVSFSTFEAAQAYAVSLGGYLVTFTSEAERTFLAANVGWSGPHGTHGYVGLYQDHTAPDYAEPNGGWKWVNNEPLTIWPFDGLDNAGGGEDYGINYGTFQLGDWSPGTCCTPVLATIEWDERCATITAQPQSLALLPNAGASFAVEVEGVAMGFQWRKDGNPLSNGGRVSGADSATLTISGVQNGDQGSYDCVVTSACGSLTSDAATLSCAPIVLSQPGDFVLLEPGTQLAVSVPANAAYSYRWRQNGQNLFNFPGVIGGVTTRTLSLLAVDPSLEGTYDLVITSPCGTVTTSPTLVSICDLVDFNHDGLYPDTTDIDDFLSVFSGGFCSNDPHCGDVDFNNDGLYPDTADIDALLSVFSGGPCLP